jgi:hypothetical protein
MLDRISRDSNLLVRGDDYHAAIIQMRMQALGQITCGRSIE